MTSKKIQKRIFIVGSARSGTTLLHALMATQDILTTFKETHFFDFGIKRPLNLGFYYISKDIHTIIDNFYSINNIEISLKNKLNIVKPKFPIIPGTGLKSWVNYLINILDSVALERKKSIWLEKTPEHVRRIDLIEKYVSDTRFIHILRDGPDTIASYMKASSQWGTSINLKDAIERWNLNIRYSLKRAEKGKDYFVHYKKLTNSTKETLRKIFEWMDLPFKQEKVKYYISKAEEITEIKEKWKQSVFTKIEPKSTFADYFTDKEKSFVVQNIDIKTFNKLLKYI